MFKTIFTRSEIRQMETQSGMTRREFGKLLGALGLLGYIDTHSIAMAASTQTQQLGMRANQTAGAEGTWTLTDIEGKIPTEISGTLYRTAPGESERFGVKFKHAFDGDAFVSGYSMRDGKIWLNARFVNSPQRVKEQAAGKMIYSEFGTMAPGSTGPNFKNQPNVNIIPWDGRLLALSEGGHPTAVNPNTLSFESYWDFHGTLPRNVNFTAHPKYDPATGEGFAYGMEQGPTMALCVFRMNQDGTLTTLHKIPQRGFFMLHDMFITQNYLVFAIPPVKYNLGNLLSGKTTVAKAMEYFEAEPIRFVILKRDGTGKAVTIEQPSNLAFHNGNAFEKDGNIVLDTFLQPDGDEVLESLQSIDANGNLPLIEQPSRFTRLILDPRTGKLISRTELAEDQDFPRFDIRQTGKEARHLYVGGGDIDNDPLRVAKIVRHDLAGGQPVIAEAGSKRAFGEAIFVPREGPQTEDNGWVMNQGYDGERNESYLEIRDAATLELQARAWTGQHLPLGFHGNFMPNWFVNEPA